MTFVLPGLYRHYKGGLYRVLFTAHDSTNTSANPGEEIVIYISVDGKRAGQINARRLEEFESRVLSGDLRFERVGP